MLEPRIGNCGWNVDIARSDRIITNLLERFSIHNKAEKANDEGFRINKLYNKVGRTM